MRVWYARAFSVETNVFCLMHLSTGIIMQTQKQMAAEKRFARMALLTLRRRTLAVTTCSNTLPKGQRFVKTGVLEGVGRGIDRGAFA